MFSSFPSACLVTRGLARRTRRVAEWRSWRRGFAVYRTPHDPLVTSDISSSVNPPEPIPRLERIHVENPIVELDGDEMARIMWQMIKEKLIFPFIDMEIDYYDLSITFRDETVDQVVQEAGQAILKHSVGIKCPTITPDASRVLEFNLRKLWPSAGLTLRESLDTTVFYIPVVMGDLVKRSVPGWYKPIVVAVHSQPEDRQTAEMIFPDEERGGTLRLSFEPTDGEPVTEVVTQGDDDTPRGGVAMATYISRSSVEKFARACFEFALAFDMPLYFSSKNQLLKQFDGLFVDVFNGLYQDRYKKPLEERGLCYQHRLTNDMMVQALQSSGGFVWACKAHDGDILSDLVSEGYGGRWMVTKVAMCPSGRTILVDTGHGTVTKHFRARSRGEKVFTNPMACIHAWSQGLRHRARLDNNQRLMHFCSALEEAARAVVAKGHMTKDLCNLEQRHPGSNSGGADVQDTESTPASMPAEEEQQHQPAEQRQELHQDQEHPQQKQEEEQAGRQPEQEQEHEQRQEQEKEQEQVQQQEQQNLPQQLSTEEFLDEMAHHLHEILQKHALQQQSLQNEASSESEEPS